MRKELSLEVALLVLKNNHRYLKITYKTHSKITYKIKKTAKKHIIKVFHNICKEPLIFYILSNTI